MLAVAASVSEQLLRDERWAERLPEVLAHLGPAVSADRAYVYQNVRDSSGRLWMDLIGEWDTDGVRQVFDDPSNHLHPYAPDFARWIELLGSGRVVHALVAELPAPEQRVLSAEGAVSILAVPIFIGGDWWGYIGVEDCAHPRVWPSSTAEALRTVAGALGSAIGFIMAEEARRFSEDRYRSLVENGPAVIYVDAPDEDASAIYVSPQIEDLLGYTVQEWYETSDLWPRILHPDDRSRVLAENERHNETCALFRMEYRMFHKDGRLVWVHDEASMVRDEHGLPRYSHGVMMDISERKRGEESVAFRAYHDELTALPSRSMFEDLLDLSIQRAERHDGSVAVLCVDVDDFRLVNDSLGHQMGDELLKRVADRLREATRETDLVARRGGDQFLMLLSDLDRDDVGRSRRRHAARRGRGAAHPRGDGVGVHRGRDRALRIREPGHQSVPAGCRGRGQPPAQRRSRDVREQEERGRRATSSPREARSTRRRSCSS